MQGPGNRTKAGSKEGLVRPGHQVTPQASGVFSAQMQFGQSLVSQPNWPRCTAEIIPMADKSQSCPLKQESAGELSSGGYSPKGQGWEE